MNNITLNKAKGSYVSLGMPQFKGGQQLKFDYFLFWFKECKTIDDFTETKSEAEKQLIRYKTLKKFRIAKKWEKVIKEINEKIIELTPQKVAV